MKFDWLKARQTRYTGFVTLYIAIIIAVLSVGNFLANRHNKSFDFTANKRFSLSDQTVKIGRELKTDVTITYFDQSSRFAGAKDLLDRYDNLSARLKVDYVDPDKKPQVAKAAGVRSYGTIFVDAMGRREEAKSNTEEEITGALVRALKGGQRTVCVVAGSGEHSLEESGRTGYSNMKEALEKNNYRTQVTSLIDKPEVPKECTVLLVGGPRFDYLAPQVEAIRNFVEGGGRALVLLDPPVKFGREEYADNAEMVKLLESWGVVPNKDLVLDTSGIGQLFGLSEVVPLVSSYESHAIVRELREVATAFPMARSLDTKTADKTTVDKLFSTSGNSYATSKLNTPEISIDPNKDKRGPLTLGVAGTYNTGKENNQGRFVVVGSSGWISNNIFRFNGNRDMLLNMLNWLSSDEDLISIRPKDPEDRRLTMSRAQMSVLFYSAVLGLPLIILAAGIGMWWRRR